MRRNHVQPQFIARGDVAGTRAKRVTALIDADIFELLRTKAADEGVAVSSIVARMLETYAIASGPHS